MPTVELIYDRECPNVADARAQLLRAFVEVGLLSRWSEYVIGEASLPAHAQGYGSPTILVNGRDITGSEPESPLCCRIYLNAEGRGVGAPSVAEIATALRVGERARSNPVRRSSWRASLAALPGIGTALLPKVACPACWRRTQGF